MPSYGARTEDDVKSRTQRSPPPASWPELYLDNQSIIELSKTLRDQRPTTHEAELLNDMTVLASDKEAKLGETETPRTYSHDFIGR